MSTANQKPAALAAEQRVVAAVSRIGNRKIVIFLVACKI
jgi:hypothetical protein